LPPIKSETRDWLTPKIAAAFFLRHILVFSELTEISHDLERIIMTSALL
jgi:hypothetical protein